MAYGVVCFVVIKGVAFSVACCVILTLETLPPGDLSGVVVYLRIVLTPEEASHLLSIT
jgi:hypothetical protein